MKLFIHFVAEHCNEAGFWKKDHTQYPSVLNINPQQLKGLREQLGSEIILECGNHLFLPFIVFRHYKKGVIRNDTVLKKLEKQVPDWLKEQLKSGKLKKEDLEDRKKAFADKITDVLNSYKEELSEGKRSEMPDKQTAKDFYDYWTTIGDQGTMMKFELKKYHPWNTKGRMGQWMRNKKRYQSSH